VFSYDEDDSRQVSASMAHQLIQYQDHLTNLFSYLLLAIKSDILKVAILDTDTLDPDGVEKFRTQIKGQNYSAEPLVLEVSRSKLEAAGVKVDNVVQLIETRPGTAINIIFQAILQLISLVERLMALSPQEQGQPAPREISATEVNLIAGTTESVYSFISDAFDEYRAAKKRVLYESYMALGNKSLRVPVLNRFTKKTIEKAGFEFEDEDKSFGENENPEQEKAALVTILGSKEALLHDYIFTARDGSERAVNSQSATTLVQLLNTIQNPIVLQAINKERYFSIVNEVFRLSGAGVDLNLQVEDGESPVMGDQQGAQEQKELESTMAEMSQVVEQNANDIRQIQKLIEQLVQGSPRTATTSNGR